MCRAKPNRAEPDRAGPSQTEPGQTWTEPCVAPHQVVAELDGALQVPAGGGELLQVLEAEAEAGAAGADLAGAVLRQEGHVLHPAAGALRVHRAVLHPGAQLRAPKQLTGDLHREGGLDDGGREGWMEE